VTTESQGSGQVPAEKGAPVRADDKYLIPGIILMLAVVVVNFLADWNLPKVVVSAFLAIAIAFTVHRLLGGIDPDTTFNWGVVKVSGSLAALLSTIFFFNNYMPPETAQASVTPAFNSEWVPVSPKTGSRVKLSLYGFSDTLESTQSFDALDLAIRTKGFVAARDNADLILGKLDEDDLRSLNPTVSYNPNITKVIATDRIPPGSSPVSLSPLPFTLRTGSFNNGYVEFTVVGKDGKEAFAGSLNNHSGVLIKSDSVYYAIQLISSDQMVSPPEQMWARFTAGQLEMKATVSFPPADAAAAP